MQDLNDMIFFAEVAERGSFTAASRALGLPKSRLSRRVAHLETQLGVQLMQRSSRKLSLTQAGELYLRHCLALRDGARAAYEAIAQVQTEPRGTVRLSCPVTLAQSTVGQLLPVFIQRYPLVRVEMRVLNRPVDPIEEGVDIALRVRSEIENSATLVAKTFCTSRLMLVASVDQLRRQGPVHMPSDLSRLDTVWMTTGDSRSDNWRLEGPNGAVYVHTHEPRYVADDLLTLLFAVLQGTGASLLPDYMCQVDLQAGRLVRLLPEWGPPTGITHAMFPARRALVPAVRLLLDFLSENLKS